MITIDSRFFGHSGIGTYLSNVIPGVVAAFPDKQFCLLGHPEKLQRLPGIRNAPHVRVIASRARMYSLREQFDYLRLIPKETQLYFSTHYNVPLFFRGKMLVTVYDLFHLAMPQLVGGPHKTLYARALFNAVRRKAHSIITISDFTKAELLRLTGEQGRQPITPIHLGVDPSWYSIGDAPRPHPRPYVLYVGNIKPHKNLAALVKAFASIADVVPHDLVLVGKKDGFITGDTAVSDVARALGDRVHFTGRVEDSELRQYFAHAEALVFPSIYEGFGLPPLEAMAARCPTLVSNAGPMPEVCGDAALYCDPFSVEDIAGKLLLILRDPALRESLRQRGLDHVRGFTWERCVAQTCEVIRGLLAQPQRRAA